MTSPTSTYVVAGGALLASPALYSGFVDGTLPMGSALFRLAVAVLVVWLGVVALESLVDGTSTGSEGEDRPGALPVGSPVPQEAHAPDSTPSGS